MGCGTGYVICSLALLLQQLGVAAQLLATDINAQAAAATRATLAAHNVRCWECERRGWQPGCGRPPPAQRHPLLSPLLRRYTTVWMSCCATWHRPCCRPLQAGWTCW